MLTTEVGEIRRRNRTIPGRWPTMAGGGECRCHLLLGGVFLIHEGWNRLEDQGWAEEFGSESQRTILNLDHRPVLDSRSQRERTARLIPPYYGLAEGWRTSCQSGFSCGPSGM
jgi:hypothetical protein